MAEFHPVPIGRPPPSSWLPALGSTLAIVLALAIVKPWHSPGPSEVAVVPASASADPAATRSSEPQRERDVYDPRLFGNYEPAPGWELWPAGYVVEFGIAGPVDVHGQESPGPSRGVAASGTPTTATQGPGSVPPGLPAQPAEEVVDLGHSDHLIALGINTPADVRVTEVRLRLLERAPLGTDVPIVRLPTLWESDHFLVIGIADPDQPGETAPWIPGEYLLELETAAGEVRAVRLRVSAPAN